MTLGEKVNRYFEIRDEKDAINAQLKEINEQQEDVELQIIADMEQSGLSKTETSRGSISVAVGMYPEIEDKESFYRWVIANNRWDMVQKRISRGPVLELFETKNILPDGVSTYTKQTINMRRKR